MSRRIVRNVETGEVRARQRGYIYQKQKRKEEPWDPGKPAYGRYRVDVPGQHKLKEVRVSLGCCRTELDAMLDLRSAMEKAGVLDVTKIRERISSKATFRGQAVWWIKEMKSGRIVHAKTRERIDPNTINSYQNALVFLNESIGDSPLASVNNLLAKTLIAKMKSELRKDGQRRFAEKTIVNYFRVLCKVVASALDDELNPIHSRKWNLAAIGLPRVNPRKQRRPTLNATELTTLLSKAEGDYQVLYFFCLVTGLRVSEAVAVEIDKHLSSDCSIVYVRQQREKSVNRVKEHLKTQAGYRDVDIHPDAAAILRNFIGHREKGFLFRSENKTMFDPRNVARDSLDSILEAMGQKKAGSGFHIFRRFREYVLQRSDARPLLVNYWMGHTDVSMADRYGLQIVEDIKFRQEQVTAVGLGFEPPPSLYGLRGLQIVKNVEAA